MRILRIPNLLVVALTQALLFYAVFAPAYAANGIQAALTRLDFALLVLATCLVTAAGYVINDLEDTASDAINRPQRQSIGRTWSVEMARYLFLVLVLLAYLCSLLLALHRQEQHLLWIFPLSVVGLSAYSLFLKKVPLWGNLLVAAYCAGVAGLVLLAERSRLNDLFVIAPETAGRVLIICTIYMLFAFWSTLLRELIKDVEDQDGDRQAGYRTLAVVWSVRSIRVLAYFCVAALAISLSLPLWWYTDFSVSVYFHYSVFLLLLLLLVWTYFLRKASAVKDYHRLSQWLKWYMVGGILLILLF